MPDALLSFDEVEQYLDGVADGIPEDILKDLNGGIVLLPNLVPSPHGSGLYTLGTYHYEPLGMGRYITIHYGSFARVAAGTSVEAQKKQLKELLYHELTHHLESMAGVRDLELKDELFIENHKKRREQQEK